MVAESIDGLDSLDVPEIVGVADATVQRDEDVLRHLQGAEEYLYVSGIAVLIKFRYVHKCIRLTVSNESAMVL